MEASTVLDEQLCASSDETIFKVCKNNGYCLATLDKDFSNILNFPPESGAGIVVFRLPNKPGIRDITILVHSFLHAVKGHSLAGKLWIVEKSRIREYQGE